MSNLQEKTVQRDTKKLFEHLNKYKDIYGQWINHYSSFNTTENNITSKTKTLTLSSDLWNSVYTVVQDNSASWVNPTNTVQIYSLIHGTIQQLLTVVETQSVAISSLEMRIQTLENS